MGALGFEFRGAAGKLGVSIGWDPPGIQIGIGRRIGCRGAGSCIGRATCTRHKCTDDAFELGGVAEVRQRDYGKRAIGAEAVDQADRSEEHTSELQSLMRISYAVFCLTQKKNLTSKTTSINHIDN